MVAAISRRRFCWIAAGALAVLALPGCSSANDGTVVIYSCAEGVRNESLITAMHARFPEYDIRLHYIPTGNCAAKLRMEGSQSEADIVLDLEGGYIKQVSRRMRSATAPTWWIPTIATFPSRVRAHASP